MSESTFQIITIDGTPFHRGFKYGIAAKPKIHKAIDFYKNKFETEAKIDWDTARSKAMKLTPAIEAFSPDLLLEVEGIAKGAVVDIEDILALNVRSEILFGASATILQEGCTSLSVLPPITEKNHTYVAQNWDFYYNVKEWTIILMIKRDQGPSILTVTEAGLLCRYGFNSAGIGLACNYLKSNVDKMKGGIPLTFIRRKAIEADLFVEALKIIQNTTHNTSCNYLIGTDEGYSVNLEVNPEGSCFLLPQKGIITHSNHFIEHKTNNPFIKDCPDSIYRQGVLHHILENSEEKINEIIIGEALKNHVGYPASICRHAVLEKPHLFWNDFNTITSIIMNLSERTLFYSPGNPCLYHYSKISL